MKRSENLKLFRKLFGAACTACYSAAGRVNIIGEHVDYCGGKVMPAALDMRSEVYVRANGRDDIRIAATTYGKVVTLKISDLGAYRDLEWGNYQAGVAYVMQKEGYSLKGCDMLFDCTVPFGSGLSSSAAIEVSTVAALAGVCGEKTDGVEAAIIARRAESEYCGVNCGIMDQFASAMGKKGNAVLLDCNTLEYEYVPVELGDFTFVIANSNKPHNLVESKYNERRAEADEGLNVIRTAADVSCLAEVTPELFGKLQHLMRPVVARRTKHIVFECDRVRRAAEAVKKGDVISLGTLLDESHRSLSELYEVTGKELDTLVSLSRGTEGCIGSRMTGAGFGGCTISLVRKDRVGEFTRKVGKAYKKLIGYAPSFYAANIDDGIKYEDMLGQYVSDLIAYARKNLKLKKADEMYAANRLLRVLGEESYRAVSPCNHDSAAEVISQLSDYAFAKGYDGDEERLQTELFDCVSLTPSAVESAFARAYKRDKERAMDGFYDYCTACDYVKTSAIAKNKFWKAEGTRREIQITINLSKPEKNNRQTAAARNISAGYPECMICAENVGYCGQGRSRQTLRTIPLKLNGEDWFWQFSPYAYFYQHGIAVNSKHTPMTLDDSTPFKLADFTDFAPQYFIGCNAPLPIVGGSILAHEHLQGGKYFFPMFGCGNKKTILNRDNVEISLKDWYNSVVEIRSGSKATACEYVNRIVRGWKEYENGELGIIPYTDAPHNTATLITERADGEYVFYVILRNNRCDERYPDGIFHVHPEYMNIKSESIGLIEAMGMFILPARLDRELAEVAKTLEGRRCIGEDISVHRRMTEELMSKYGNGLSTEKAAEVVKSAVNSACEHILENTAVFKENTQGEKAFEAFVRSCL